MATSRSQSAWDVAAATPDPELPALTIGDLGILRRVHVGGESVVAVVTPTYSGCPATREIALDVRRRLLDAGFESVEVRTQLAPPWSTDWITDDGRRKLAATGIAPPHPAPRHAVHTPLVLSPIARRVRCPQCGSFDTVRTAEFGATACKALHRCERCAEPFEYVKER